MHARFDTASLHAACTSVSEAHDNALTLPEEYFDQSKLKTQNKWPIQMPDKNLQAAMATTRPITGARTNPYLVRRVGAATALDPDMSLQTDAWPRLSIPNLRQKQKIPGELSILYFDGDHSSFMPNKIIKASLDEMNIARENMKDDPSIPILW